MPKPTIGQAELEILHYIHDHHPVTVRDVAAHVFKTKGHTRTTVLNVMTRLWQKGYLTRKKAEGVFVYAPSVSRDQLMRTMVGDFVERALAGSLTPFVAYLAEDARLSEQDVRELKDLVRGLDSQSKTQRGKEGRP